MNDSLVIDFGECEKRLRKEYGINEKEELIIFKIEHFIVGFKIPKIEYVLFNEKGIKLIDPTK